MSRTVHSAILLAISCLPCANGASLTIRLDETFPSAIRDDLSVVAKDVATAVTEVFGSAQPPLSAPIVCGLGPPPPRTSLDDWFKPTQIRINLTVNGRYYAQLAFQLGHELGHVMIGIHRSNPAFETIATAVSLETLDRLSIKWQTQPPHANWANYATAFRNYREATEIGALDRLGLLLAWQRRRLKLIKRGVQRELDAQARGISSDRDRDVQTVGAMIVRTEGLPWRSVVGLEACTSPTPILKGEFAILPPLKKCVQQRAPVMSWLVTGSSGTPSPATTQKPR